MSLQMGMTDGEVSNLQNMNVQNSLADDEDDDPAAPP